MASKIQILPENLCNQIAAGEVVERPASVVKELLENCLDAGAAEIHVEVEGGGKRLIRVTDDGEGMGREDVLLCLERHATSKIRSGDDLFRLGTLGFRGEALPSIAAVSRFTVRSRSDASLEGWEVYAEGGTVRRAGALGMPRGTCIEVRDLFFNTPVRKKFLRKDETELGHIGDTVTRLALANPEVQFRLFHNGRALLEVPRQAQLEERVASLLGRPLLRDLIPVNQVRGEDLGLRGFVSRPEANRAASGSIYTYINGRFIRDRVVQHAVMDGFRHLLVKGRYPVAVLFLTIDPAMVDVNVHPTKHEVRFREQRQVHDFIAEAVRETLRPASWVGAPRDQVGILSSAQRLPLSFQAKPESAHSDLPQDADDPAEQGREEVREALQNYARCQEPERFHSPASKAAKAEEYLALPLISTAAPGFFASLRILGQYRRSYILAQDETDLLLIDQHAAHERIGFERLRGQFRQGGIESQSLLFPRIFEVDFREAAQLTDHLSVLASLGFEVEPFGGKAFALKGVPRSLGEIEAEGLLRDVAAELGVHGDSGLAEESLDKIFILMACHGMIRANQTLAMAEMEALLRELDQVDFKTHCPHGRPVLSRLTLGEVERMFKRS